MNCVQNIEERREGDGEKPTTKRALKFRCCKPVTNENRDVRSCLGHASFWMMYIFSPNLSLSSLS